MKSIRVFGCDGLSGLGLSYLVANKQFLVQLKIDDCNGISSEGYHCLTTLTNLTSLTVINSNLDNIGLLVICANCLLIEDLDIRRNGFITKEGLNNIHCLMHLKTLFLSHVSDDWLAKLSHSAALTHLDLQYSTISDKGLSHLSSLVSLTSVIANGRERLIKTFK
jgi:Leucine-rich repeat (LRR) protein